MDACELCHPGRETEWIDDLPAGFDFDVFRCRVHNDFMIVARHHGEWEPQEIDQVIELAGILFPGKEIRWEQYTIPGHPHCHVVGT